MYVQRQISAFLGNSDATDPVEYGIGDRIWSMQDVYPSKIMIVNSGGYSVNEFVVAASGTFALDLPQSYTSSQKLAVYIWAAQTVKVTTLRPGTTTSVVLIRAGTASDSGGFFAVTGRITAISVVNPSSTATATVQYFCYQYPSDISVAAAWRDGAQTIGTAPTE